MKLTTDSGSWSTGSMSAPLPLLAVLEVSGAVLSWTVDSDTAEAPVITFTDHLRADWLWRVIGETGHVALVDALRHRDPMGSVELAGIAVTPGSMDALRRLATGHWMRRWWPAGERDGIPALDRALLDAEIALMTVAAEDYFTDDTIDADVTGLLAPHTTALNVAAAQDDPRIIDLVDACRELAADSGLDWPDPVGVPARRDDYALAAGPADGSRARGAIATGVATVDWSAVPPGMFDAAENTVDWAIVSAGRGVDCVVQAAVSGPERPAGVAVTLRCGDRGGTGVLDADGRGVVSVLDDGGHPLEEAQAWNLNWQKAVVRIGVGGAGESAQTRDRVRAFARARLAAVSDARPAAVSDAFLAEVLAAESDY